MILMQKQWCIVLWTLVLAYPIQFLQSEESAPLPRKIIALYTGKSYEDLWFSKVLQYAGMPIEQQGIVVEYQNALNGFPSIKDRSDILGALVWDLYNLTPKQAEEYLNWALETIESGKKLVLMETLPGDDITPTKEQLNAIDRFWTKMGVHYEGWENQTVKAQFINKDPLLTDFERSYIDMNLGYPIMKVISDDVSCHLTARENYDEDSESCLIFISPIGSYVASDFALYKNFYIDRDYLKWYINPFLFFQEAFNSSKLPKPDTTTIAGRRIYYSHIDGDGWNSLSEVEKYRNEGLITAEVILREIIEPHPELPVTVGAVMADLDPDWAGIEAARTTAKKLYSLEHVEMSSHTYSHPFIWGFFENYTPQSEKPYLKNYKYGAWNQNSFADKLLSDVEKVDGEKNKLLESSYVYPEGMNQKYMIPRAYANQPFNLNLEIEGSLNYINKFSPNEVKKARLIQWSGNCLPFELAIKEVRLAGALNINGGDTRFDNEFSSYGWVRPLGMNVGKELQIFSSMANENLYTDLWSRTFFGFKKLKNTIRNTGSPIRLKPINLYYHTYSGEKLASLLALKDNIQYIKKQKITPLKAAEFVEIVQGFYSAQIFQIEENSWKITNRGALQTIRFENATYKMVDFNKSTGIIGQRHFQGNLYVYLDKAIEAPIIAIAEMNESYREPIAKTPYLIESRWVIDSLAKEEQKRWSFNARGYGNGEMSWSVPIEGNYQIVTPANKIKAKSSNHLLNFVIEEKALKGMKITIELTE